MKIKTKTKKLIRACNTNPTTIITNFNTFNITSGIPPIRSPKAAMIPTLPPASSKLSKLNPLAAIIYYD